MKSNKPTYSKPLNLNKRFTKVSKLQEAVAAPENWKMQGVFGESESESVSVKEGDSHILPTGITIQGSDEVEWRLNEMLIFRISSVAGKITTSDKTEGALKGRLKVNEQTGDLKITNIKTTDSGQYTLKISSTRGSSDKTFIVNVVPDPGLHPGAIAGIVITVIAVVGAAVGGIIYYFYGKKGEML